MRRAAIVPIGLVIVAVASACGGSDPAPGGSSGTSGGTIAGTSTSGFVNSSGGASGKTASGGTSGPQPTDLVDTTDETLDFNGKTRPYLLSKPKTIAPDRKYALVISFHGNPGSPKEQHDLLPFDSASKDAAFIAYPQAADGSEWNLNLPSDGNEDMDFVKALIDDLASKQPIDTSRVLGFGYSGGAYFLSQYACRVGGVLKMVALLAGGAPEYHDGVDEKRPDDCVICPAGATPIFIAHGMNDTSDSPFEGGDFARICWAEQNGCTNSSLHQLAAPCSSYNGCDDGKPVEWCPVPDQDHSPWGGSIQAAWTMFNGL
jgi:poly(3-hydroxybutyrate) depolymerase